jgi:hypothetical protein
LALNIPLGAVLPHDQEIRRPKFKTRTGGVQAQGNQYWRMDSQGKKGSVNGNSRVAETRKNRKEISELQQKIKAMIDKRNAHRRGGFDQNGNGNGS